MVDETPKLKAKIQSCQDKIKDLTTQLSDFNNVRASYAQLATAFTELSQCIVVLEDENTALKTQHRQEMSFKAVTKPSKASTTAKLPNQSVESPNRFRALHVEECSHDDPPEVSTPHTPSVTKQSATSTPTSTNTPLATPKRSQSSKSSPPTRHTSTSSSACPQILIFSNSICKRIDEQRFYRGRTSKVYAKSGATIADVHKLVMECELKDPKYVILQAWTNNIMRESIEAIKIKARALIDATLEKFPTAQVIVSGILPRLIPETRSNTVNRLAHSLNDAFEQNCAQSRRVSFANHIPSFVGEGGQIRNDLYWDSVHLNNGGLGKLVNNLRKAIDNAFPIKYNQQPKG